jgi:DNA replication protein DnaC
MVRLGESARWVAAEHYISMYKDEWDDSDNQGRLWRELKYILKGYDVVVIDGLGEEPNTDFERKVLASLVRTRVEHELTTIITTPLNSVELADYGSRMGYYVEMGVTVGG